MDSKLISGDEWYSIGKHFVSLEEAKDNKNTKMTRESLTKQSEDLLKEYKGLGKDLTKTFSEQKDKIGVSDAELDTLESYVRSGDIEKVKEMTSNKDIIDIAKKFKKNVEDTASYSVASDEFTNLTRYAEGVSNTGSGLYDFIASTDVFDKAEMDTYFGDYKDKGKDFKEELADGKLTTQEMADKTIDMIESGENILSHLPQEKLKKIAEEMVTLAPNTVSMEDLYLNSESGTIDASKLYAATSEILRQQQYTSSDDSKEGDGEGDLSDSAKSHKDAVLTMIDVFKEESKALQQAAIDARSGNYNTAYTSVGGGRQ